MEIEKNQMWKDSNNNIFVVDGFFLDEKVRCHRACTTEEVIFNNTDFDNLEYMKPNNDSDWDEIGN